MPYQERCLISFTYIHTQIKSNITITVIILIRQNVISATSYHQLCNIKNFYLLPKPTYFLVVRRNLRKTKKKKYNRKKLLAVDSVKGNVTL